MLRIQEYVGFHETEAMSEIHFYHIKKHFLLESMFNIEQLIFFSPSCYYYQCLNMSLEHFLNSLFCFDSASQGPSPLFLEHFPMVLVWEQGPRCKPWADTTLSLVLCPVLGEILSLIPSFATDLLGSLG